MEIIINLRKALIMKIILTFILSLLAAVSALGQIQNSASPRLTKTEQKILNLERELLDAIRTRDDASLNRIISSDFSLSGVTNLTSPPLPRAQFIENTLRYLKFDSASLDKTRVQVYGNTAMVHTLFKMKGTYREQPFDETRVLIDTWVKRKGRWQVAARYYITSSPLM